ncbi:hypothetical protein [Actinotalea sp. C106]|uniref:hypothetical protein n=1 Tax=Actinotalea sp. C106 TaxID=2908644 RepID=UPI002027AA57|nr:hypothetical protein [Actinotalea sp. C106]
MTQGPDQDRPTSTEAVPPHPVTAQGTPPAAIPQEGMPATAPGSESRRARLRRRVVAAPLATAAIGVLLAAGLGFGAGFAVGHESTEQVATEGFRAGMWPGTDEGGAPGDGSQMPGAPGGGAGLPDLEEGSAEESSADT